ncbi:MAG TPA: cyanophycin synthetase [Solirubrobacteraceae bacterium]|nr:cyanophycin synthetase [Solirubrobacteraceae bacterium]
MSAWSAAQAEEHLLGLELFGVRFGLERMRRLMTALGSPQRQFASIHVVGTNGKSSTVRMAAAILERHGLAAGAYVSPHLISFAERIRIGDRELEPQAFGATVQRAARAAAMVNRTLADGERVTQFELLTAAAYSALAARGVDVAVIEAGLGGRYDATNVIPSRVQLLTNVGLEHTRWLGPTIADISREKLAVVRDDSTLVVGALDPAAAAEARAAASAHRARLVPAPTSWDGGPLAARGAFQRGNFALARAAVEAFAGRLDEAAVRAAAAGVAVPGRCEVVGHEPLTILDCAHNPSGARALADSLPEVVEGRPVVGVLSILDDKDAAGMLRALLPCCRSVILTSNRHPRALSPATLESLARQVSSGEPPLELEPDPQRALSDARDRAGRDGAVVATGSIYLVADLVRSSDARASTL